MALFGFPLLVGDTRAADRADASARARPRPRPTTARRSFPAGAQGRLTYSWLSTPLTADEVVKTNLRILRARSREQSTSNPHMRKFRKMVRHNVIGPKGVVFQAKVLGADGALLADVNRQLEAAWRDWGRRRNCDAEHALSWVELQARFVDDVCAEGEALFEKFVGPDFGPYGFQLYEHDPEQLDVQYDRDLGGGRYIRMGIEYDQFNRPVAYHMLEPISSAFAYGYGGRAYRRIKADRILHAFVPEMAKQRRGIPWASTALMDMGMLNSYKEAHVVASRAGATKVGVITSPTGEEYDAPTDSDGWKVEELEPGTTIELSEGQTLSAYDPSFPHGEFGEFYRAMLRTIASGLDVNYNELGNDLERVNYSSMRTGVLEIREVWKAIQEWAIGAFHAEVYSQWIRIQRITGQLAPIRRQISDWKELEAVSWQPRRWPWVDPLKDRQAHRMELDSRLNSYSAIIRESGRDPDEVWTEIADDLARLRAMGIDPISDRETISVSENEDNEEGAGNVEGEEDQ